MEKKVLKHQFDRNITKIIIKQQFAFNNENDFWCKDFNYKSIKYIMKFSLYFALIATAFATLGIDVSLLITTESFQCIKNDGISFAIIRAYMPNGSIDPNAIFSLSNARSAGLSTDIYMTPCRGNNATNQVNDMMNGIPPSLYGMVWIEVVANSQSGCSYNGHNATSNCAFITELVNAVKARGKNVGVFSISFEYTLIMGGTLQCSGLSSQQVWYYHLDNNPTFVDFPLYKFGGWTTPNIKQYQKSASICGVDVNRNYS